MKRTLLMISIIIVVLLAACASPQTGSDGSVPGTGATQTVPAMATSTTETTSASGGGSTSATAAVPEGCVGVDTQALVTAGQTYYEANCASCHGAQGEGTSDIPALANNAVVNTQNPVELIARFFSVPGHLKTITTDEAAAVFTYVRGAFGNTGQPICPSQVLENRPAQ